MAKQYIANVTLLVNDYDEAIAFYTEKLGFTLKEDVTLDVSKRWVVLIPSGNRQNGLVLAKADNEEQKKYVGNQTGGRVFLFLHTDDFWRDYERMRKKGVIFMEEPRSEIYATVAVFKDLYGNLWDLLEPKKS